MQTSRLPLYRTCHRGGALGSLPGLHPPTPIPGPASFRTDLELDVLVVLVGPGDEAVVLGAYIGVCV